MKTKNICPRCGTVSDAAVQSRFCLECGADLMVSDAEERAREEAEARAWAEAKEAWKRREAEEARKREEAEAEERKRKDAEEARKRAEAEAARQRRETEELKQKLKEVEEWARERNEAEARKRAAQGDGSRQGRQTVPKRSGGGSGFIWTLIGILVIIGLAMYSVLAEVPSGSGSSSSQASESAAGASISHTTSTQSSGAASSSAVQTTTTPSAEEEGIPYNSGYFEVMLPSAWDGKLEIFRTEENREAMNATNYCYHFKYDKIAQFTIRCAQFNLDGNASVGSSSSGYQIEFHPTEFMDADDERFVRNSIKPL